MNLTENTYIIDNTYLHLIVLFSFLSGFGAIITGVLKQNHTYYRNGFYAFLIGFLVTCLITVIVDSFFVLSPHIDYAINLLFAISAYTLGVISIVSISFYYSKKVIPHLFVKMAMFLSLTAIIVTFTTSLSTKKKKEVPSTHKFVSSEVFEKANSNKNLSKNATKSDSILVR